MLKEFTVTNRGFQSNRRSGEVFDFEGKRWVVIKILNMKLMMGKVPIIKGTIIAQQVGKYQDYNRYYKENTITDRIPLEGREYWDKNIKQVGTVVRFYDKKHNLTIHGIVTEIESFKYEFVDLIVNYRVERIEPWNEKQMNKAIQENRLSTFKVLSGNKE